MKPAFGKVVIIGLGLIGSSIARAATANKLASSIVGVDSNELSLSFALKHGFVTHTSTDAAQAVAGCDVVIIATPSYMLGDICEAISPHLPAGALVMDTGSVKQLPLDVMSELLPAHVLIVPAHPIAGSEKSGVAAGSAELFEKKRVIITPDAPLGHESLQRVTQFWQAMGARVEAMPAELHDTVYGYVSHLPQLLAFAVKPLVAASDAECENNTQLARFLRISDSDKALWSGIFLLNRDIMIAAANRYIDVIVHIRKELGSAPSDATSTETEEARLSLLPRIVSSCLITTVMEAEKKAGFGFVRYAGSGFADFTSPSTTDPEAHLAGISDSYASLIPLIERLEVRLAHIVTALEKEDADLLMERLE